MRGVVSNPLLGTAEYRLGTMEIAVAGKTGTAQRASPNGGYAAGKFVASFVGFAPARDPAIVAMIAIDVAKFSQ